MYAHFIVLHVYTSHTHRPWLRSHLRVCVCNRLAWP